MDDISVEPSAAVGNLPPNNLAKPQSSRSTSLWYRYTYRTCVFQVSRVSRCTPPEWPIAAEGRGWQGVSQLELPSGRYILNIILTTATPHICKKYAPIKCHTLGGLYGIKVN